MIFDGIALLLAALGISITLAGACLSIACRSVMRSIVRLEREDALAGYYAVVRSLVYVPITIAAALLVINVIQIVWWTSHDRYHIGYAILCVILLLIAMFHVKHTSMASCLSASAIETPASWYWIIDSCLLGIMVLDRSLTIVPVSWPAFGWITALVTIAIFLVGMVVTTLMTTPYLLYVCKIPERFPLIARFATRWSLLLAISSGLFLWFAGIILVRTWSAMLPQLLICLLSSVLPAILFFAIAFRIWRRGKQIGSLRPLLANATRTLHNRRRRQQDHLRRTAHGLLVGSIVAGSVALSMLWLTAVTPANTWSHPYASTRDQIRGDAIGMVATATNSSVLMTPTSTSIDADTTLVREHDGVRVTLTLSDLHQGAQHLHFTITDTQGNVIPNLVLSLLASPAMASGTTTTPQLDAQSAMAYTSPITFSRPGSWTLVLFVANADQTLATSVVFGVDIA
jgi:hypothetical protein